MKRFEVSRRGTYTEPNQDVGIPFTSGQLNDVLKTLTVLDLNGGRIAGVAYGTAAPLDRQLGDLRLRQRQDHEELAFDVKLT